MENASAPRRRRRAVLAAALGTLALGAAALGLRRERTEALQQVPAAEVQAPEAAVIAPMEVGPGRWILPSDSRNSDVARKDVVARQLTLEPLLLGRDVAGFRVASLEARCFLEKAGLCRGDVVKAINGTPLNTIRRALGLYEELIGADRIDVRLERDGKPMDLRFDFK